MLKLRLGKPIVIGILGATTIFLCCACSREMPAKDTEQINNATINQEIQDEVGQVESTKEREIEAALIGIWHAAPSITAGYSNLFYFYEDHTFKLVYADGDEEKRVLDIAGNWAMSEGELTLTVTQKTVVVGGELVAASPSATSKYQIEGGTIEKIMLATPEIETYILGPIEQATDSPYEKKTFIDTMYYWKISDDPSAYDNVQANPFFFQEGEAQINYKGLFMFNDIIKQEITLHIQVLDTLERGTVYTMIMEPIEGVPQESLTLGYFYIQEDKIYKLNSREGNLEQFLASESIPEGSELICQEEGMEDSLDTEEKGWHHYIEVDGKKRIYHAYSNLVETGYYESYTWEKEKGLTEYRSGYGAGRDSIELERVGENLSNESNNNESKNDESLIYTNNRLGFTLSLPQSWKGKYLVVENDIGVEFIHRNEGGEGSNIFSISTMPLEEWLETEQYMYKYLATKQDTVYVSQCFEPLYDIETEEGLKKALEISQLRLDIDFSTAFRCIE